MRNKLTFLGTLVAPTLIVLIKPLRLDINQSILLASVILAATWWATRIVERNTASIALIISFLIFSRTPLLVIFKFPLSSTFVLIVAATLLGEGIIRSNLADRLASSLLVRYGHTPKRLIIMSYVLGVLLIFFIPQPFPRVIILSAIYIRFLNQYKLNRSATAVLLFSIYTASTCTSMFFLNGDILLNYSALQFGSVELTWIQWAIYMAPPALIISILMYLLFVFIFRREISSISFEVQKEGENKKGLSIKEKQGMAILIVVMLLWMTESLHHINAAMVSIIGVVAMLLVGLLKIKDYKKLNIDLLLFLTAAFAIGGVLNDNGVGEALYQGLMTFAPSEINMLYYSIIIAIIMMVHMTMGSSITTIAIGLPGLISVNSGRVNAVVLTLLVYTVANIHYLLPFHHVTIMLGAGENHFQTDYVIRYGIGLTLLTFFAVLFIELPWWRLVGLF